MIPIYHGWHFTCSHCRSPSGYFSRYGSNGKVCCSRCGRATLDDYKCWSWVEKRSYQPKTQEEYDEMNLKYLEWVNSNPRDKECNVLEGKE